LYNPISIQKIRESSIGVISFAFVHKLLHELPLLIETKFKFLKAEAARKHPQLHATEKGPLFNIYIYIYMELSKIAELLKI
jgi:hypothetical protein